LHAQLAQRAKAQSQGVRSFFIFIFELTPPALRRSEFQLLANNRRHYHSARLRRAELA
jgi:hypothetical protein